MNYITEARRLGIDTQEYLTPVLPLEGDFLHPVGSDYRATREEDGLHITDCAACRTFRNAVREALAEEEAFYLAELAEWNAFIEEQAEAEAAACIEPFAYTLSDIPSFVWDRSAREAAAEEASRRFEPFDVSSDSRKAAVIREARDKFAKLAGDLAYNMPPGREASLALTKLEEAALWAVRSIASA